MNLRNLAVAALLAATATAAQQPFQLDPGFHFDPQGIAVGDVLERPDGKIIVSGIMQYPSWDIQCSGLLLEPNGSIIPSPSDIPALDWYFYMGGKMVPWGDQFYVQNSHTIQRLWMDGGWDSAFMAHMQPMSGGGVGGDYHVFPDGRLLQAGNYSIQDSVRGFVGWGYGLLWRNSDGSLDTTRIHRRISNSGNGALEHIKQLPDGKFMCSGGSGLFEGVPVEPIFRVHDDGALDTSFHVPDLDGWIESYGFLPQPGGKVLAYGRFHFADMVPWTCLVRLLPNGQLDPTFNNQQWFEVTYGFWSAMVQDVEPIGEGLLAVTGTFDRINGEDHGGIAMLDTAGNLLPGYFEGSGCGGYFSYPYNDYYQGILGIEPAQDGGYYIYGYYRGYDDGATNDPSQRLLSKLYGLNVGINEQPARSATLHIAPNPSHGGAVQLSVDEVPKRAILSIHDASGRVVLREEWPDGTFTHTLQAGLLAPGTYVVRVAVPLASRASASGTDTYTGKMIVLP